MDENIKMQFDSEQENYDGGYHGAEQVYIWPAANEV